MQLILDAGDIDIERNMSTIEQESLNEKFLANKIIEHLADDISSGNKENIQKQDNIIPDLGENDIIDTDKETTAVSCDSDAILKNNLNEENTTEDTFDTENIDNVKDGVSEVDDSKPDLESECDNIKAKNLNDKEYISEENETCLEDKGDVIATKLKTESDTRPVTFDLIENVEIEPKQTIVPVTNSEDLEDIDPKEVPDLLGTINKEIELSESDDINNLEKQNDETNLKDESENNVAVEIDGQKEKNTEVVIDGAKDRSSAVEIEYEKEETTAVQINNENEKSTIIEKDNEKENNTANEIDDDKDNSTAIEIDHKKEESTAMEVCEVEEQRININLEEVKNTAIEKHENTGMEKEKEKYDDKITFNEDIQVIAENVQDKIDESKIIEKPKSPTKSISTEEVSNEITENKIICKLSNNLDIFSDDDDDPPETETSKEDTPLSTEKQCINIDEDDDIMLIDEDSHTKDSVNIGYKSVSDNIEKDANMLINTPGHEDSIEEKTQNARVDEEVIPQETDTPEITEATKAASGEPNTEINEKQTQVAEDKPEKQQKTKKPLLPKNFVKSCKKNLADMTRDELEEFCVLKIVESIVDRSNLGEIKAQLKNLTSTMDECKNKCLILLKQNKDLQVVLKSVQEEQKSASEVPIAPLKITRSVGMQVVMVVEKNNIRKKSTNGVTPSTPVNNNGVKPAKIPVNPNTTKTPKEKIPNVQQIPVPRLVPAVPTVKTNLTPTNTPIKQGSNTPLPNGIRTPTPVQKVAEKRPRSQAVTVDLTDDEPPPKMQMQRGSAANQALRVVGATQNLSAQRFAQNVNSPRKVYIPISGAKAQNVRPGQTIMLKTVAGIAPRQRFPTPHVSKLAPNTNQVRLGRLPSNRHPAPLPEAAKQYQPPYWKTMPPPPDLKLSKVENGIVISWKIDGYQEENHEDIASYQLYAYQETQSPPSTTLWKKIGDVKALPLPMACTLTQFMAGYKYFFAVRAVDVRSRIGPFSLPGSILLLNKI